MSLVDIVKKTIESEDAIIDQIAEPDVAVYHFLQEQFEKTNVSSNLIFQYVYCNFYTLDAQKVDKKFIRGYFELMQSLKGSVDLDMEVLLFKVYHLETDRILKFQYSFTSKLAHTLDNNRPIWDSKIARVFSLYLTSIEDNGVNGDMFINAIENLQSNYRKIIQENLLSSTIGKFNQKFDKYSISDTKKLDFIFGALAKVASKQ